MDIIYTDSTAMSSDMLVLHRTRLTGEVKQASLGL